jgi:hypothetical protein
MSPGRGVAASTAEPTRAHTAANQPNGRLSKTDTDAHDPLAPPTSPRPRRAPGVRPHPHDLLQEQPVATGMFDERGARGTTPPLSFQEGYRWGPFPAGGSRYPFVVLPERHICGLLIRDENNPGS